MTAGIAVLHAAIGLLFAAEQRRAQAETGAVLSAFFSQTVLHDMDKWAGKRTVAIVIQRDPDCRMCPGAAVGFERESWFARSLKARASSISDPWFAQSSRMTRATLLLNNVFLTDISTDLHLPAGFRAFFFVNPSDLGTIASDFQARFPNNLGIFVVSHIGLNPNGTEALLYVDHFCSGLCGGGGGYLLMRKVNGAWYIADQHSTWVS